MIHRILPLALLLLVVTCCVWRPCLDFGFVFDDHSQIELNPRIQSIANAGRLMTEPLWAQLGASRDSDYYRPLFSLVLMAQYLVFGPDASLWHAVSLALHCVAVLMVFLLLLLLFEKPAAAWVGSLLFALLPVNAQVVSWISASDESLWVILVLMALCAMILASGTGTRWLLLSGALFTMALFTKETALGGGLVLLTYGVMESRRRKVSPRWFVAVYFLPVTAYLLMRALVLRGHPMPGFARSPYSMISMLPSLAVLASQSFLGLHPFSMFYEAPIEQGYLAIAALAMLLLLSAAVTIVFAKKQPLSWVAVLLVAGPLVPWAFALFHNSEYALLQDRYLYMPSIALSFLVCYLLSTIATRAWAMRIATAACLLACAAEAVAARGASQPYRNDVALFTRAVEVAPHNIAAIGLLADAKAIMGETGAIDLYAQAVRLRPDRWDTNFHLAMAYLKCGERQRAAAPLQQSLSSPWATGTQQALSWYELGKLQAADGDSFRAASSLQKAEALQPASRRVHGELAAIYAKQGKRSEAEQEKLKALRPGAEDSFSTN